MLPVALDDYLRGCVPREMPALWPPEALKAQAVAARTFAAVALGRPRHPRRGAHLCDGTHCQMWRPDRTHERTDEAIAETAGLVLWYGECDDRRLAQAFYSARCGGRTRPAWNPAAAPWCEPVDCECMNYPASCREHTLAQIAASHAVGLCQYGAMAMARAGATFDEILHHYFSNVTIEPLFDPKPSEEE